MNHLKQDTRGGWKRPGAGGLDVLPSVHTDEARQMARLIQPDVQLDQAFVRLKRRPREDRSQIDGSHRPRTTCS